MKTEQAVHALYVQATRKASEASVRAHLSALEDSRTFAALFVREAMKSPPDGTLQPHWAETLKALSRTTRQYSVGDKAFIATLEFLQAPVWLQAVQAATVGDEAPLAALAALAREGSESSHDALLAEFERARSSGNEWALKYKLKRLAKYAKPSPHLDALDAAVKKELERRDGARVEGSLAQKLGLNVDLLSFFLEVRGMKTKPPREVWLIISASDKPSGLPTQALGLDEKPPRDLVAARAWLSSVTRRERVTWQWDDLRVKTNLRGKYRDAMVDWVRGLRETPVP